MRVHSVCKQPPYNRKKKAPTPFFFIIIPINQKHCLRTGCSSFLPTMTSLYGKAPPTGDNLCPISTDPTMFISLEQIVIKCLSYLNIVTLVFGCNNKLPESQPLRMQWILFNCVPGN